MSPPARVRNRNSLHEIQCKILVLKVFIPLFRSFRLPYLLSIPASLRLHFFVHMYRHILILVLFEGKFEYQNSRSQRQAVVPLLWKVERSDPVSPLSPPPKKNGYTYSCAGHCGCSAVDAGCEKRIQVLWYISATTGTIRIRCVDFRFRSSLEVKRNIAKSPEVKIKGKISRL